MLLTERMSPIDLSVMFCYYTEVKLKENIIKKLWKMHQKTKQTKME